MSLIPPFYRVEGSEDKVVPTLDKLDSVDSPSYFLMKNVRLKSITCPSKEKFKRKLPLIEGLIYQDEIILGFQKVCTSLKILWKSIREI
jgi:hypothetical protein